MSEPTVEHYHGNTLANRVATGFAATRPAFLTASVLPVLCGAALSAFLSVEGISMPLAAVAAINIALIHSGANVLNDYFDSISGNDAENRDRVYPFSGGSRFIQNHVLSERDTLRLGSGLLAAGIGLGLYLVWISGPLLLLIGVTGTLLAVTYSSSPPCLACKGLGDVVIGICFGLLPVAGTSLILMRAVPQEAIWLGSIIACFVAAILWVNSIPDIAADRFAGKLTLPVRLGASRAAAVLPLWFVAGFALLILAPLPHVTWSALLAAVPAVMATRAALSGRLEAAMPLTILTHALLCGLLAASLLLAANAG